MDHLEYTLTFPCGEKSHSMIKRLLQYSLCDCEPAGRAACSCVQAEGVFSSEHFISGHLYTLREMGTSSSPSSFLGFFFVSKTVLNVNKSANLTGRTIVNAASQKNKKQP